MTERYKVVKWYDKLLATLAWLCFPILGLLRWSLHGVHMPAETSAACIVRFRFGKDREADTESGAAPGYVSIIAVSETTVEQKKKKSAPLEVDQNQN